MKRRSFLRGSSLAAAGIITGHRLTLAQSTPVASPAGSPVASPVSADGYYPSGVPEVPDAYTKMPEPFKSYDGVPGKGGTVRAMTMTYSPPPTPKKDNLYWQELEKRLGVTWEPTIVPWESYGEKASAILASGDLPDMFYLNYNQTSTPLITFTQQGAFLDLTEQLTGENLKKYPNLATYSQDMWDTTKLDGKIYGVPCPATAVRGGGAYRRDWADKFIGGPAKNADEWYELATAATKEDPDGNGKPDTWAIAPYWRFYPGVEPSFRVVNNWGVDESGAFVKDYETEGYLQTLEYRLKMMNDGLYHPDTLGLGYQDALNTFLSGHALSHDDGNSPYGKQGFQGKIQEYYPDAIAERHPAFAFDGGDPLTGRGSGTYGFTAIPATVTDPERVDELLRIFDYLASPFGSEEWLFRACGVEGTHFEYNDLGWPVTNEKYSADQEGLTIFLSGAMPVTINPQEPELAVREQQDQLQIFKYSVSDPTAALYSPSSVEVNGVIEQVIDDALIEIFSGRQSLDTWPKVVEEWAAKGGDKMRAEYEEAYKANQG